MTNEAQANRTSQLKAGLGLLPKASLILLLLLGGFPNPLVAQNIVGYINIPVYSGNNLIANQLDDGAGDLLNSVLTNGVLAGSTFSELDPTTHQLMAASVFNGSSWSIDYVLGPNGTGGVLNSPGSSTVTTVGTVLYYNLNTGFTYVPPNRSPGLYLLADGAPRSPSTFEDIIGRGPLNGDFVETLNGATQTYSIDTFENGIWDHGTPALQPGQSAYFGLEVVPEPSTMGLFGAGALMVIAARYFKR